MVPFLLLHTGDKLGVYAGVGVWSPSIGRAPQIGAGCTLVVTGLVGCFGFGVDCTCSRNVGGTCSHL